MRAGPLVLVIGAILVSGNLSAQTQLPSLFGDHMVFQTGKPIVVWGQDAPGQKVTVKLSQAAGSAQSDGQGRWKVQLPAMAPGGPFELAVAGSSTRTLKDVLVGEVWLASGQSNMEFRLDQAKGGDQAVSQATDPKLRLFLQSKVMSPGPLAETQGEWKVCSPESAKEFSAVAYYFGKELRGKLGTPVGLIASSWGGSYVESWTPEKALKKKVFQKVWDRWNGLTQAERDVWVKGRFPVDLAVRNIRFIPKDPSQAPLNLEAAETSPLDISILGPGKWASSVKDGSDLSLKIDGGAPRMTGSFLSDAWGFMTTGLAPQGAPRDLSGYKGIEFEAKGTGNYILFLSQPSVSDWDNYRTPLSFEVGRTWKEFRIDLASLKQSGWGKPQSFTPGALTHLSFGVDPKPLIEVPCALYNAMIHPFTRFPLQGFLWYQGEANAIHAAEYQPLLEAMIGGWRKAWGDDSMAFLLAQLPNYVPGKGQGEGEWPKVREAQRLIGVEPHNGMAVLLDLGESHDIHPKDKADVGYRLDQIALGGVYGRKDVHLSPSFQKAKWDGNKVLLSFEQAQEGLEMKGSELKGFEIAGKDGEFEPAQGRIEKDGVQIWSDKVPDPQAVRYAWADDPVFNLYGKNGLPASPFQAGNFDKGN